MQHGAVAALQAPDHFYRALRDGYRRKRDLLIGGLDDLGFVVFQPEGTYFVMADHTTFGFEDDRQFARHLVEQHRVAAIPPSVFYSDRADGSALIRFSFSRDEATIREALDRMAGLGG